MKINDLILAMIDFYQGHPKQIQHLIKVHSFARVIGIDEGLSTQEQERLEVAAIVHDIGIKPAWEKYNSSNGKYQEELGPAEAIKLLNRLNYDEALIERVAYLVGHHHTYSEIDGLDYQILLEADFLVNGDESNLTKEAIEKMKKNVFKTKTGIELLNHIFEL